MLISIKKLLATEFMTEKVSQNLNLMQKTGHVFSKVIECLEKSNTRMNTEHSNTNRLQKNHQVQIRWGHQMNRTQNVECKVLKYKVLKYLNI